MSVIGFIGPGVMGAPMIKNLIEAGHEVRAFGRSQRSRDRIEAAGALLADSAVDAAAGADVVITMLPDSPDVHQTILGSGGLAQALTTQQIYVDMSTIRPEVSREIYQVLTERGVGVLDAPVSGGEAGAREGALSIMVGGQATVLEQVREVLDCLGTTITHVGPAGAGQLTKAANQLVVAANIQAVAEAIVLLEAAGAEVPQALHAIGGGLAGSAVLERKRDAFLEEDFAPGFRIELHNKDLRIVGNTARDAGVSLPMTGLVAELMAAAGAKGYDHLDHSALLKLAREANSPDQ